MANLEVICCPFCDFEDFDTYILTQHVETIHPEDGISPFVATNDGFPEYDPTQYLTPSIPQDLDSGVSVPEGDDDDADACYIECPTGCGERICFADLPIHLDFHLAESSILNDSDCQGPGIECTSKMWDKYIADAKRQVSEKLAVVDHDGLLLDATDDYEYDFGVELKGSRKTSHRSPSSMTGTGKSPRRRHRERELSKATGHGSSLRKSRRYSKARLGPYANEKSMPRWLRKMLEEEPKITKENKLRSDGTLVKVETIANQTPCLIPVLAELSGQDKEVERTFLCHSSVRHVFKLKGEGGFCGYRNIQTLISYIQDAHAAGHDRFPGKMPTILALQDMIERAWDMGHNATARNDIGPIKNTRKYIGTSEAQALFLSLNIECAPEAFGDRDESRAYQQLLDAIMIYFLQDPGVNENKKVIETTLPPIYFQHPGHSMTIVGLEMRRDGSLCLLVFDPGFTQSPGAERIQKRITTRNPANILKAYRRDKDYLRRYREFEILKLAPTQFPPDAAGNDL